ncbi:hypothetical protein C8R42DRAFT_646105 [Lentinula raphanica]|nr:hypothetical protein C8R42DRAFT_646105 [Lentinula raphanica]
MASASCLSLVFPFNSFSAAPMRGFLAARGGNADVDEIEGTDDDNVGGNDDVGVEENIEGNDGCDHDNVGDDDDVGVDDDIDGNVGGGEDEDDDEVEVEVEDNDNDTAGRVGDDTNNVDKLGKEDVDANIGDEHDAGAGFSFMTGRGEGSAEVWERSCCTVAAGAENSVVQRQKYYLCQKAEVVLRHEMPREYYLCQKAEVVLWHELPRGLKLMFFGMVEHQVERQVEGKSGLWWN